MDRNRNVLRIFKEGLILGRIRYTICKEGPSCFEKVKDRWFRGSARS